MKETLASVAASCKKLDERVDALLATRLRYVARTTELTEKIKGNTNEAIGNVKQESGNPETRAEGRKQEKKGEAQQLKGEVEGKLGNDI